MLDYGKRNDIEKIKEIWELSFPHDDFGYTDYFFNEEFDVNDNLVIRENDQIISVGSRKSSVIMLYDRPIMISMIFGVATLKEHQKNGHMKTIMEALIDHAENQELLTFIQAYDPKIYYQYGFTPIYYRVKYTLKKESNKMYSTANCVTAIKNIDLLKAYVAFVKRFTGFKVRDDNYYDKYVKAVKSQNGIIVSYYNNGLIMGYATLIKKDSELYVEEIIYGSVKVMLSLLSYAFVLSDIVVLDVTVYEKIEQYFSFVKKEIYESTLVRINDIDLFNKIFQSNVLTIKQAFSIGDTPLYFNEDC